MIIIYAKTEIKDMPKACYTEDVPRQVNDNCPLIDEMCNCVLKPEELFYDQNDTTRSTGRPTWCPLRKVETDLNGWAIK